MDAARNSKGAKPVWPTSARDRILLAVLRRRLPTLRASSLSLVTSLGVIGRSSRRRKTTPGSPPECHCLDAHRGAQFLVHTSTKQIRATQDQLLMHVAVDVVGCGLLRDSRSPPAIYDHDFQVYVERP